MRRSAAATNETLERLPALVFVMLFASPLRWEALATARPFTGDATRRWRNLAISLVNFLLGGLVAATLLAASAWIAKVEVGIAAWSDSAAVMVGVLLLDMTDYWRHRVSHRWKPLWRLHRLHHTDPRIDVTTALRSHPIEQLLRPLLLVGAIVAFGIPRSFAVLVYPLLGLPVLLFQHANVELPASLDRALVWLVSTPSMHLVYHSRRPVETDSNYATGLAFWDRLFGTFSASTSPHGIGLEGFDMPPQQTLRGMLRNPWEDATSRP